MGTLDTVMQMQQKGMTDLEISRTLQSQGIGPREINDALNQAKIKSAVSAEQNMTQQNPQPSITESGGTQNPNITSQYPPIQSQTGAAQPVAPQVPAAGAPQPSIMADAPPQNEYYPEEALYSEDQYYSDGGGAGDYYGADYYGEGYGGGYTDTETMSEIAEQVVNEKFREYRKQTGDVAIFQTMMQDKVAAIEQRLTRIENTIDKLQHAVIQKIGEFGESSTLIRRDLEALHNTTSKLMNPLIDQNRELERIKGPKKSAS